MHPRDELAAPRNAAGRCGLVAGTERLHHATLLLWRRAAFDAAQSGSNGFAQSIMHDVDFDSPGRALNYL